MCRRDTTTHDASIAARNNFLRRSSSSSSSFLLLTHDSFIFPKVETIDKDDANKRQPNNLCGPTVSATFITVVFYNVLLYAMEHATKILLQHFAVYMPILDESPDNAGILARHFSVDFVSLVVCVYIGLSNRHICAEMSEHFVASVLGKKNKSSEHHTGKLLMHESGYEDRIFKYHPGAQRLSTFFFAYLVKNFFDVLYWNDGIVYAVHHVLACIAAWGCMFPGCCHFYVIFYAGISEISTCVLILLANFDAEFGIASLGEAFPQTKLILGALFVLTFVVCRIILWPFTTYFFARDVICAFKSNPPQMQGRRINLCVIFSTCMALTLIQVLFVAIIVQTGMGEIGKMMNSTAAMM